MLRLFICLLLVSSPALAIDYTPIDTGASRHKEIQEEYRQKEQQRENDYRMQKLEREQQDMQRQADTDKLNDWIKKR